MGQHRNLFGRKSRCKNLVFVKNQGYFAYYSLSAGKIFLNGTKSNYLTATNAKVNSYSNQTSVIFGPNTGPASLFNTITNQLLFQAQVIDINDIDDLQINMNISSAGRTGNNNPLYFFDLYPMYGSLSICNRNLPTKVDVLTPNSCKHVRGYYKKKEVKGEKTVLENIVEIIKIADGECRFRVSLPERQPPLQKEFKFTPQS